MKFESCVLHIYEIDTTKPLLRRYVLSDILFSFSFTFNFSCLLKLAYVSIIIFLMRYPIFFYIYIKYYYSYLAHKYPTTLHCSSFDVINIFSH